MHEFRVGDRVRVIDREAWAWDFREQVVRGSDLVVSYVSIDDGYVDVKRLSGLPVWRERKTWSVWHGHLVMGSRPCPMEINRV